MEFWLGEVIDPLQEKIYNVALTSQEAELGVYPKSQLFEAPWLEWAKKYPLVWLDMPQTWARRKKNKTREIPRNINEEDSEFSSSVLTSVIGCLYIEHRCLDILL